jgi:hypothetical protein
MASTVRIKRRITGASGAPGALKNAELAYNEVDNILYYGKGDAGDGSATSIIQIGGSGAYATKDYVDSALTNSNLSQYAKLDASNTYGATYTNTFNGTVNLVGTFQLNSSSVTASAAELNVLDGITASTAELNILDGVTATYSEINVLDGITASTAELNILAGVTATYSEINVLDGITASTAELNILDGVTATYAELNILDGATVSYAELNLLDGSVSETVVNGKAVIYGDAGEIVATSASTTAGLVVGTTLSAADGDFTVDADGNVTVGGALTVTGNFVINGTTTTVNSTVTTLDDPIITLGGDTAPSVNDGKDRGVEYRWHNGSAAKLGFFGYDSSAGRFVFIPDAANSSEVFSGALGSIDVGSVYIGGSEILTSTSLASSVVSSSLTSVGTLTSGTWQASTIAVAYGGTGATNASDARTNLGLVIGTDVQAYNSTLAAVAGGTYTGDDSITTVGTISSGTWSGTTIAVASGGTGATNAADARTNLGLVIGTDVQAYDAELNAIAGLTSAADKLPYFTGAGAAALATFTSFARTLTDDATASDARSTLGLGTIATQDASNVAITGGTIDNVVIDGGVF